MALYKITLRVCKTALLVSAENIVAALNLIQEVTEYPQESVTKVEEYCNIRCALDICYNSAEDKLEALLNVLPSCLDSYPMLTRDIAATVVYDASGISGMVKEIPSKEI